MDNTAHFYVSTPSENEKLKFIENILSFGNIGYWKLNLKTEKLFVSKELLNILKIEENIYKDDPELIHYFIHPDDQDIFNQKMFELRKANGPLMFKHRMITSHMVGMKVEHLIYMEDTKSDAHSYIIGIIKFDKE